MKYIHIAIILSFIMGIPKAYPCTSVIVSGKATASGKPLLFKNRDTGTLDNRMQHFTGPTYTFIGLVNAVENVRSVWAGTNSAGFSIMNTASYNLKDDDVPESKMGREGIVMFQALGICATTSDFEHFLDTLTRPMLVETNFGVIDAKGGAAYYEVNNHSWKKYDVNDPSVAPEGYRVVTNYSESGRPDDARGVERYLTASAIMKELCQGSKQRKLAIDHGFFFDQMSRSYRHERLGVDYNRDYKKLLGRKGTGFVVDLDFIPRRSTSASVVIEGVSAHENPLHTVMWTILGYPSCSVAIPHIVGNGDHLPAYMKATRDSEHSKLCDLTLSIKDKYVFPEHISNGKQYFRMDAVQKGILGKPALKKCAQQGDRQIRESFLRIFTAWCSGTSSDADFYAAYEQLCPSFLDIYQKNFKTYLP
ncbi:MAG: hypothetical protein Q4E55_04840 [Bacteroidales bacterium]|nr:hypothetical protein [Bacteroidales bacterium]